MKQRKLIDFMKTTKTNYPITKGFIMKNSSLFFVLLAMALVSGCATDLVTSLDRDNSSNIKSGSIKYYSRDKVSEINKETLKSYYLTHISDICGQKDFRIVSVEKSDRFLGFLFHNDEFNLKFECIDVKK